MKVYVKGDRYKDDDNDYETFGITEFNEEAFLDSDKEHAQKIEVYGDEELRNEIIRLLNARECDGKIQISVGVANFLNAVEEPETISENVDETVELPTNFPDTPGEDWKNFEKDLESVINCHSMENGSNTPDWILAEYLVDCLKAFNKCSKAREKWYGRELRI